MKTTKPVYYRLVSKDDRVVGFRRVVTEYLPFGHSLWQFAELEHDPEKTVRLSAPAHGIEKLKRESFSRLKSALQNSSKEANESGTNRPGAEDI